MITDTQPITEDPRVDDARAFDLYWQTLITERAPALAALMLKPDERFRALTRAEFREAMQDAYNAGRDSQ